MKEAKPPRNLSTRARRTQEPPISWLMRKPLEDPEILSLAAGFVDQQSLPSDEVLTLCEDILKNPDTGHSALQYGSTIGHLRLRERILERLSRDGIHEKSHRLSPDDVVVTNGSQQFLYLLTNVLADPGDIVLVEDPTYFVYLGILEEIGAIPMGIPTDSKGIVPEGLDYVLSELHSLGLAQRVKLLYVMSYYANPTGLSLAESRREAILEILQRFERRSHRVFLLEDAAYRDLALEESIPRPIKELDSSNSRVAYTGTFSKAFSPGLRLGYGILPPSLMIPILRQKGNQDFGSSNFGQNIVLRALETGVYDRHVMKLAEVYRTKRDGFLEAMKQHLPDSAKWDIPRGGLYCWARFPGVDTGPNGPLFRAALERKVLYVPGEYCYCRESGTVKDQSAARLCYGLPGIADLEEGLRRLGEAVRQVEKASG